jgi:hypothetical protein
MPGNQVSSCLSKLSKTSTMSSGRGRMHHRTGLHRADLLARVPQVFRRSRKGQGPTRRRWRGRSTASSLKSLYQWEKWAAPKGKDGKVDHNTAKAGDDLRDFVNQKLFPYLHGFTQKASGPNTIEYKIGQIFGEIKNKISSGYNLREIIDHRRASVPLADGEARTFASLRSQDPEHGQRRA